VSNFRQTSQTSDVAVQHRAFSLLHLSPPRDAADLAAWRRRLTALQATLGPKDSMPFAVVAETTAATKAAKSTEAAAKAARAAAEVAARSGEAARSGVYDSEDDENEDNEDADEGNGDGAAFDAPPEGMLELAGRREDGSGGASGAPARPCASPAAGRWNVGEDEEDDFVLI